MTNRDRHRQHQKNITEEQVRKIVQEELKLKTPLSQRAWIIGVTIFIAFVGAGTGVYTIIKNNNADRSKCKILSTFINIASPDNGGTLFVFVGSISNDGERPLFRQAINGELIINGISSDLQLHKIPEKLAAENIDSSMVDFTNKKDLSALERVLPFDIATGELMFTSNIPYSEVIKSKNVIMQVIFIDRDNKKYSFDFPIDFTKPSLPVKGREIVPNSTMRLRPAGDTANDK